MRRSQGDIMELAAGQPSVTNRLLSVLSPCDPKWRGGVLFPRATQTPDVNSQGSTPIFLATPIFLCHICLSSLFELPYLCHLPVTLMFWLPEQCSHFSPFLSTNKAEWEEPERRDSGNKQPTEPRLEVLIVLSMRAI